MLATAFITILLLGSAVEHGTEAFQIPSNLHSRSWQQSESSTLLSVEADGDADVVDSLRIQASKDLLAASKLRADTFAAEQKLRKERPVPEVTNAARIEEAFKCTELKGSSWEMTYRFSNEPESRDEEGASEVDRKFYSGKIQLKFLEDGYTTIIGRTYDKVESPSFEKIWGWDVETSTEDSLDYLLFSADIQLPSPIETMERFYFQARVDEDNRGVYTLSDGSVTVKRNVQPPGGFWGLFSAEGILAQFRIVGEFKCKPIR